MAVALVLGEVGIAYGMSAPRLVQYAGRNLEQLLLIEYLLYEPRSAVYGPAGTGRHDDLDILRWLPLLRHRCRRPKGRAQRDATRYCNSWQA